MTLDVTDQVKFTERRNGLLHNSSPAHTIEEMSNVPIDFHQTTNCTNIMRVYGYSSDLYEELNRKSMIYLNLDAHCVRKAPTESEFDTISSGPDRLSSRKSLFVSDDVDVDKDEWRTIPTEKWRKEDTQQWLVWASMKLGQAYGATSCALVMSGEEIVNLTCRDFVNLDPDFGEKLYNLLPKTRDPKSPPLPFEVYQTSDDDSILSNNRSDGESIGGSECVKKRPPGRPRILGPKVKTAEKLKIWQFIQALLFDPKYCPKLICWENYAVKRFRFVNSDAVAKLWGKRKKNPHMTYEKFSRAMRYYYKKKILVAVPQRRLVYEFGEKATGFESDNPILNESIFEAESEASYQRKREAKVFRKSDSRLTPT